MRVRNRHTGLVSIGQLSIAPLRIGTVPDDVWEDWLRRSSANRELAARCLEIVEPPNAEPTVDRMDLAVEAIRGMSTEDDSLLTADGRPTVQAIRQLSGIDDLTASERDQAWEIVTNPDLQEER